MRDVSEQKKKSAPEAKGATAVRKFHTHSIPLDMEDIARDWEKPVVDAGIAAKASVIVRVGMLDLGAGTGSFRVREMMHRIAYPLGVHVRADVNLTDIEATCTDGREHRTYLAAGTFRRLVLRESRQGVDVSRRFATVRWRGQAFGRT